MGKIMDIYQAIKDGKYEAGVRPTSSVPKVCFDCKVKLTETTKFCPHCGEPFRDRYDQALAVAKQAVKDHNLLYEKLSAQFKQDAIEYCNIKGNPKADRAFAMAWDDRHSEGYAAVVDMLENLSDIMG